MKVFTLTILALLLTSSCEDSPLVLLEGRQPASVTEFRESSWLKKEEIIGKFEDLCATKLLQRMTPVAFKKDAYQKARLIVIEAEIETKTQQIRELATDPDDESVQAALQSLSSRSPLHHYVLIEIFPHIATEQGPSVNWNQEYAALSQTKRFKIQEKSIDHRAHFLVGRRLLTHNFKREN